MTPIIEVDHVTKTYAMGEVEVQALKGVSFKIEKGEFVAIIGTSGSGKSTLMHIIGILDKPSTGRILLHGTDVSSLSPEEQADIRNSYIGFVFQSFNLLARTSAMDNVALPLIYSGVAQHERNERAKEALIKVGLGDRLDHTSTQLSGGQQQRVAIARALINNPSLILADEPTGNLDTASGEAIMEFFKDLNDSGNTIVLVTHEPDIALQAKRVVEIKDGLVIRDYINKKRK
jgi:putative ABC transport system ATP-binding protein